MAQRYNLWHNLSVRKVIENLETHLDNGLFLDKVIELRGKWGENKLPEKAPLSKLKIFLDQFKSPLVYILVIAGTITLFFHLYADSVVIFAAVVLNTFIGFFRRRRLFTR